jgi:hypothetical protein
MASQAYILEEDYGDLKDARGCSERASLLRLNFAGAQLRFFVDSWACFMESSRKDGVDDLDIIVTSPSVEYEVVLRSGEVIRIDSQPIPRWEISPRL